MSPLAQPTHHRMDTPLSALSTTPPDTPLLALALVFPTPRPSLFVASPDSQVRPQPGLILGDSSLYFPHHSQFRTPGYPVSLVMSQISVPRVRAVGKDDETLKSHGV
jgi:hypothetical protein